MALGMAAIVVVSYIRSAGKAIWAGQMEQDYGRISRLMKTEISEACLVQVSGKPDASATLPATPCTPASAKPCEGTTGTTLYLLVPVTLRTGTVTYRVISYSSKKNQLLRTGPPISATGALDVLTSENKATVDIKDVILIDNLFWIEDGSNHGFKPKVSPNCTSATIDFEFTNSNQDIIERSLEVSVGSPAMMN
jgi:hypothetical protein